MSGEYNPFLGDDSMQEDSGNPFNDDELEAEDDFYEHESNKPTMQVEDSEEKNDMSTYTSLEEKQVTTIMRSVSMDEDTLDSSSRPENPDADLFVKVDSPEKHVEGYVSYCVTTQTTRAEFELPEYKVQRRYQDFLWLRQRLEDSNPTHIIPALPEKFTFSKHLTDKYEPDFLKTRQKALDKFMSRLVDHPVLSFNNHLHTFLTAKGWEMTAARKSQPGAASRVGGSVRNTAAQLMMKNRDEEFMNMIQYNTNFQVKMKTFATIADQIAQDRFYLIDDFSEYGSAFKLWSNSETKLADTLTALSKGLDNNITSLKSMLRVHESRICEPIREYVLYCDSVRLALKKRDQIQIEHELSTEELAKRRAEKEEIDTTGQARSISTFFGKDPEKVKEEKLGKLNLQIQELVAESEVLQDKREKADHDFKADMERWQKTKLKDLKALFIEMAERHMKFYESNVAAWQESLEVISKPRKGGFE